MFISVDALMHNDAVKNVLECDCYNQTGSV